MATNQHLTQFLTNAHAGDTTFPAEQISAAVAFIERELARLSKTGAKRSDKPRCPCGAMTAKRAQARGHHCVDKLATCVECELIFSTTRRAVTVRNGVALCAECAE